MILGDIDVIGINGFYPLADEAGASAEDAARGRRASGCAARCTRWPSAGRSRCSSREIGYTTHPDPAAVPLGVARRDDPREGRRGRRRRRPTAGLVGPLLEEPDFAGFFVWRVYADPDDVSQEAPWGFSPRGKQAELVVRDAFAARWASNPWWMRPRWTRARTPGVTP